MKKYTYKNKYVEKDSNVRFRRCKNCQNICSIEELENKNTCLDCYSKITDQNRCKKCMLVKSKDQFYKDKSLKKGIMSTCIECKYKKTKTIT